MKILCIGEMLIDFTPGKEANSYIANPGGAPANVAVSISRNGGQAGFLGKLGDDDFGHLLKGVLKKEGEELIFVGGEEKLFLFMKENDISVVIVTKGAMGSEIYFKGERVAVGSMKVEAVDTTGAGDAFWGAFLYKLLEMGVRNRQDITMEILEAAAKYGSIASGLCVQRFGGIPALPYREEILGRYEA